MFLYEVFPPELIKVGLESEDKDEVFEEMVDQFCQVEKFDAREEILEVLRTREAKMSTGIHKGIAIPHGKTYTLQKIHGILGISKRGIDYDALDGQPVYVLFMILSPSQDTEAYLWVLKRLAQLLDNPQFFTDLVVQRDAQGVSGVIKRYEDILISLD